MENFSLKFDITPRCKRETSHYLIMGNNPTDIAIAAKNSPIEQYASIIDKFISKFETMEALIKFSEWMEENNYPISHEAMIVALSYDDLYTTEYLAEVALEHDFKHWMNNKLADAVDAFCENENPKTIKNLEYWWKEYDRHSENPYNPNLEFIRWEAKMDQYNIRRRANNDWYWDLDANIPDDETKLIPISSPTTLVCQVF